MTEGVPVSVLAGIMDVLSEEYGERMCGEAFSGMIEALCKIIDIYEALKKCEQPLSDDDKFNHAERLIQRAAAIVPDGEVKELLEEIGAWYERRMFEEAT